MIPPPTLPVNPVEPPLVTTSAVVTAIGKLVNKLAPPKKEWRIFAQVTGVRWGGLEPMLDLETPSANGAQHATLPCAVSRELARRVAWVWGNDRGPLCGIWRVWVNGKWPARAELVRETDRP